MRIRVREGYRMTASASEDMESFHDIATEARSYNFKAWEIDTTTMTVTVLHEPFTYPDKHWIIVTRVIGQTGWYPSAETLIYDGKKPAERALKCLQDGSNWNHREYRVIRVAYDPE